MEENINTERELGKIENPLFPEDRIRVIIDYYSPLLESLEFVLGYRGGEEEKIWEDNLGERKNWEEMYSTLNGIRDSWRELLEEFVSPDTTEERQREIQHYTEEWCLNFTLLYEFNKEGEEPLPTKIPPYRINIDPKTGERTESYGTEKLWGDYYFIPGRGILKKVAGGKDLEELRKLSSLPSPSQINISKDLVSSGFSSSGDITEIGTPEVKEIIRELQKKGKLLFGTMEGLSGGSAFFRSVCIALAKILNKQSQYFYPEGGGDSKGGHKLSGIPMDRIKEVFGESAKLEGIKSPVIKGEKRDYPLILLSYEEVAREVSRTGRISGGKDIEFIRLYINGGYREFKTDPKTGNKVPVKSSYVPGITSKKYPISTDGRGGVIFIPFVVNEAEIVDYTRKDPEVGCLLRLSPQFSKTLLRGYTSFRSDTIQLIGGGRQKDITMDLLYFLVYSRKAGNKTPQVLRKLKSDIISKYKDKPTYKGRPGKLEEHFKEAIQKSIDAKILREYKEEKTSGGEKVSIFIYNPDYLKGEEILSPDEQTGEE